MISILISLTIVSIFCSIILVITGEQNKEIAKIGCGCLMIISVLSPITKIEAVELLDYKYYEESANIKTLNFENTYIIQNIEKLVLDELGIECTIDMDLDYVITKVYVKDDTKINELLELLGITQEKIEYIESR